MIEDGVPEVLRHDRLGHQMHGIQATYSHVSQRMRDELRRALQRRWETALDERARCARVPPSRCSTTCWPPAGSGEQVPSPKYLPRWERPSLPERGKGPLTCVELRGFEPLTPSMRTARGKIANGRRRGQRVNRRRLRPLLAGVVAVLRCCTKMHGVGRSGARPRVPSLAAYPQSHNDLSDFAPPAGSRRAAVVPPAWGVFRPRSEKALPAPSPSRMTASLTGCQQVDAYVSICSSQTVSVKGARVWPVSCIGPGARGAVALSGKSGSSCCPPKARSGPPRFGSRREAGG
jgi:hypothetical protein